MRATRSPPVEKYSGTALMAEPLIIELVGRFGRRITREGRGEGCDLFPVDVAPLRRTRCTIMARMSMYISVAQ